MKVLHITYSTSGGAGIAAYRLHKGLLSQGVNSHMLCVKNKSQDYSDVSIVTLPKLNLIQKILNKIYPQRIKQRNSNSLTKIKAEYEIYSFPTSDYQLFNHPCVLSADIINLHWIGDFVNFPTFFEKVKKPIVWTLHDMNPFQSGFHYKHDENLNKNVFKVLESQNYKIKSESYKKSTINTIVSPSQWLLNLSFKSDLLGKYRHEHIFNAIDFNIFSNMSKADARNKLNIPSDKIVFSFVSHSIESHRKGFDILLQAIEDIENKDLLFLAIGPIPNKKSERIRYIGKVKSQEEMAMIYAASDAYLLPSREDNLPNTMVESLATGTPVIASAVGGMKDVIIDGNNGYLVDEKSTFKSAIEKFVENISNFETDKIKKQSKKLFAKSVVAKKYIDLYKSILND